MHVRKTARDALFPSRSDDAYFAPRRGDLAFRDNTSIRAFADRINRGEERSHDRMLSAAELGAMALVHEIFHAVVTLYRQRYPDSFHRLARALEAAIGQDARSVILEFLTKFPPPRVYRTLQGAGDDTPNVYLDRLGRETLGGVVEVTSEIDEELILLWVANQNPAYDRVRTIIGDQDLSLSYHSFIEHSRRFFAKEPPIGPRGETLVDLLLLPGRLHPTSIFGQLELIDRSWAKELGLDQLPLWDKVAKNQDLKTEEDKWFQQGGPGPGEPLLEAMRFGRRGDAEPARFSPDLNWMPNVVLIAKSVYVWLDQLGKKYGRYIHRLDQIPDEELDLLASRHINGLWLIGLFERSVASRRIKQMHGDNEALASAYSLKSYNIAEELGGFEAYESLKRRAWARGVRLAADMVPNHVGIDGDWVFQHPDWFLQASTPPFPVYRFGGPNLSNDDRIGVFIEEGYWSRTDAAVVFRRHDNWTGEDRFIYHGNDGTSMPWNDTAQLDYTKPEVRKAVIETILHVASMFPIIRFDAAMTLAKRHIQRLWFPLPGSAGAIPSRSDYAMTEEELDAKIPVEFWREVVDTVAERAPNTLLLAEAFWMMEGYFVRTLGMHRVYNSAFMNMMKREENAKYRETIKNVLDFDPEILKRFVNFMNNPDEETAIGQFGHDDRYFGVCAVMCTMPGLPMLGHGQIEGFREKYGMEYRRAKFDEPPNEWLIHRHEREIFPILEKRRLFSGVEHFALYDFITDAGEVDEDVYAYSNGAGDERALVLFNNRFKVTHGRIQLSTHKGTLGQELMLDEDKGHWLVIRDVPNHLEYLRTTRDIIDGGMAWRLDAFKYHVLTGFRPVMATVEKPYHRLAAELAGRGVPDVESAVRELFLRPIHAPLREAVSKGHIHYLASQLETDTDEPARAALAERLGYVADGLDWMLTQRAQRDVTVDRVTPLELAVNRFASMHAFVRAASRAEGEALDARAPVEAVAAPAALPEAPAAEEPVAEVEVSKLPEQPAEASSETFASTEAEPPAPPHRVSASVLHIDLLLAWIQVEAVLDLLGGAEAALEEARSRPPAYLSTPKGRAEALAIAEGRASGDEALASEWVAAPHSTTKLDAPDPSSPVLLPESAPILRRDPSAPVALETTPDLGTADTSPSMADIVDDASARDVTEEPLVTVAVTSSEEPSARTLTESFLTPPKPATWASREAMLAEWELATAVVHGFGTILGHAKGDHASAEGDLEVKRRAALVVLAATLPSGPIASAMRLAIGVPRGQAFMDVHQADGTVWLNKERYEELVWFLAEREIASNNVDVESTNVEANRLVDLALREGYRAEKIAWALGPRPEESTPMGRGDLPRPVSSITLAPEPEASTPAVPE